MSLLLNRIQKKQLPEQLLEQAFLNQKQFILDPNKRKCAFVMRRGGKSYALAIYLLYTALLNPNTKLLYMGLTKESAENIMWLNILEPLLYKFNIKYKLNKSSRVITLSNNSTIKLTGADASTYQIKKYLGAKYILVVFDEAQDIKNDLKYWIEDQLGPAMTDYGGTICVAGTAGRNIGTYWYRLTKPESDITNWSIHKWSGDDNIHMAQLLNDKIKELTHHNPNIQNDPGFRNQYLCQWVMDASDRVYLNSDSNILTDNSIISSLLSKDSKWQYLLGFDFGFVDDSAIVIAAFHKHDKNFYIIETFKQKALIVSDLAARIHQFKSKYNPIYMVGDCQSSQVVHTLRQQYSLPLTAAQKLGKEAHIAQMNTDFITNKIKIIKSLNEDLLKEYDNLTLNETLRVKGKFKEKDSKDNHAADAALYIHHFSKHWRSTPEIIPDPNISPMRLLTERKIRNANNTAFEEGLYD